LESILDFLTACILINSIKQPSIRLISFCYFALLFAVAASLQACHSPEVYIPAGAVHTDTINRISLIQSPCIESLAQGKKVQIEDVGTYYIVKTQKPHKFTGSKSNRRQEFYFTQLPILQLTLNVIPNDKDTSGGELRLFENGSQVLHSPINLRLRGESSRHYPKPGFKFSFTDAANTNAKVKQPLLDMPPDKDWHLISLYKEANLLNNRFGHELWKALCAYDATFPVPGVETRFTEVFINGEYFGVYLASQHVSRRSLSLSSENIGQRIYKGKGWGATSFDSVPELDETAMEWAGFNQKFPKLEPTLSELRTLIQHTLSWRNDQVTAMSETTFHIQNLIDLFLFINLLEAKDNRGKNLYLLRADSISPYVFMPWDLDAICGFTFDGSVDTTDAGLIGNGLLRRLWHDDSENGFQVQAVNRWANLRRGVLSRNYLYTLYMSGFEYLNFNGAFEREIRRWPEQSQNILNTEWMINHVQQRIDFLDSIFFRIKYEHRIKELQARVN
jgi:spore coat protein H